MPSITDSTRLIIWIFTGIAGAVLAALTVYLEENLRLAFRKLFRQDLGGRRPREKPKFVWMLYILSVLISITGTSIASSAPSIPVTPTVAQTIGITEPILPREPGTVRIIVAKFDESDQTNYRVTDIILKNLKSALSNYPYTEVIAIDRIITEADKSDTAIKIGEVYDASIVIWGWYGVTDTTIPLGIHFEVIPVVDVTSPGICAASSESQIRKGNPTELSDLTLQTNLSNELSYATIFMLGFLHYESKDYNEAINLFDDAIEQLDESTILSAKASGDGVLINTDVLYFFRSGAYFALDDPDAALADMEKISASQKNEPVYQFNLGQVYLLRKDYELAVEHLSLAIGEQPSNELLALSYFLRGVAFENLAMFEDANKDFQVAFKLDDRGVFEYMQAQVPSKDAYSYATKLIEENTNNFAAYLYRGLFNYEVLNNPYDALDDYNISIEINPDFLIARQARAELRIHTEELKNPYLILQDIDLLLQSEKYRTPCNLLSAASLYYRIGESEVSTQYYDEANAKATAELESNPQNASAYFVRGATRLAQDDYQGAYRDFQKAKYYDPENENNDPADEGLNYVIQYYRNIVVSIFVITLILVVGTILTVKILKAKFMNRKIPGNRKPRSRHNAHRP